MKIRKFTVLKWLCLSGLLFSHQTAFSEQTFKMPHYESADANAVLNAFLEYGAAECASFGAGEFYLTNAPFETAHLSNDDILDYVVNEAAGKCVDNPTIFRGGTGGNEFRVFINPDMTWMEYETLADFYSSSFSFYGLSWQLAEIDGQKAIQIYRHGTACDLTGAERCVDYITLTSPGGLEGMELFFDHQICERAVDIEGYWTRDIDVLDFVIEARLRGLNCGEDNPSPRQLNFEDRNGCDVKIWSAKDLENDQEQLINSYALALERHGLDLKIKDFLDGHFIPGEHVLKFEALSPIEGSIIRGSWAPSRVNYSLYDPQGFGIFGDTTLEFIRKRDQKSFKIFIKDLSLLDINDCRGAVSEPTLPEQCLFDASESHLSYIDELFAIMDVDYDSKDELIYGFSRPRGISVMTAFNIKNTPNDWSLEPRPISISYEGIVKNDQVLIEVSNGDYPEQLTETWLALKGGSFDLVDKRRKSDCQSFPTTRRTRDFLKTP